MTYRVHISQLDYISLEKRVMSNPILIHNEVRNDKAFGDARLVKRGHRCMKRLLSTKA